MNVIGAKPIVKGTNELFLIVEWNNFDIGGGLKMNSHDFDTCVILFAKVKRKVG